MKPKIIKYILLILLLVPAIFLVSGIISDHSGSVNPISNLEALIVTSGIPIIGLLLGKKWYFYYIYIASGFIVLTIIFWGIFFFVSEGWLASLITILYFGSILAMTIVLHKSFLKEQSALPPKPVG